MRIVLPFMIGLAGLGTVSCAADDRVSMSIGASVNRGVGTGVALVDHATFAWDKVCIFGPYTSDADIDGVAEVQGAAKQAHGIQSRDDIDVLLFVHDGDIAASVAHPRDHGDFGPELVGKCYSRQQAVFSVRKAPADSWGTIGPS